MKNIYLFLISLLISFSSYSQCLFTTQVIPQSSCDTTCNSFLNISANGANGPHYLFVDGLFHSVFTSFGSAGPFCPGFYNLFITDSAGCNFSDSVFISSFPGIAINVSTQNASCAGCADGSATVVATGGMAPYTYIWSNGDTTSTITNLAVGTYTVTVVDANGCSGTSVFMISTNQGCSFFPQIFTQSSCDTTCNTMVIYVANGVISLQHLFLNGVYHTSFTSAATLPNLCPNTWYNVFITDSAGCNFSDSLFITPPMPMIGLLSSTDPTCATCNDGSIVSTVTGGTPPYTYNWSIGTTTSSLQGVGPGVYCVYITDAMGCTIILCDTLGLQTGFSLLSGTVYYDLDTNGIKNILEPGSGNIQVEANPGGYTAWTTSNGNYFINVPNGTYDISVVLPAGWQQTSLPLMYNVTVNDQLSQNNNFGILPDSTFIDAELFLSAGWPRCNWNSYYQISYMNKSLMLADGEIIFNKDPLVTFVNSNPPPTTINGNTYTWAFDSLYPFVTKNISISVTMPGAGNVLNSSAIINLHDNLSNIIFTDTTYKTQTVTCSYDPNDKQVEPAGIGSQNAVSLNTTELDFTIRFQNTGNDTAFVVVLKDTLDANLDPATFKLLAASHEVFTQMDPGGILTFTFDNILLPDSNINEPASHGFVRYSIQPLQPVTDPTVITNTAYIFFDQNPAIVTNTTLTTFSDNLLTVAEIKEGGIIKAYPNPFSGEINIVFEKPLNANATLYDYLGREINIFIILNNSSFTINRNNLPSGIYFLKIKTNEDITTLKLIVK